ncbi:MAG: peptide chain release factor 1 [Oscillospiraceae bacterium]|nr:peptide chain release factor 1 [Oscillospiraceae bacterium]
MPEKLKAIEEKYEQLCARLDAPETWSDPALYAALSREQKELAPLAEAIRRRRRLLRDASEAEALISDPEMRELAQSELIQARAALAEAEQEIRRLLLPRDPNDGKNVILEIRAGIGGEEAALFAADLYRMYAMYAEKRGWRIESVNANSTELGGFKEICCVVEGEGAWSRLKYEAGGHCVKRVPETEASGRIQTSTATVAVLPEIEEQDFVLDPSELKIDTFRSSGAGGQKVNKTESAIRVTHLPTGTVVECQDERSQYKNRDRAISILRSRLYEAELAKRSGAVAAQRKSQVGTGERSEKIRTYFFLRSQVVDQRLSGGERSFSLDAVLNGSLDPLIDALTMADQTEKLRQTEAT